MLKGFITTVDDLTEKDVAFHLKTGTKVLRVECDANTRFDIFGVTCSAVDIIQEGSEVGVYGTKVENKIFASLVCVTNRSE